MKKFLLPYSWKFAGVILTFSGTLLAVLYFWYDFRFSMPVFAVFSSFLETKMFVTFTTNFADDLILILLLAGINFIALSKQKTETEYLDTIRAKALVRAMISNNVMLLFSVLFIYGSGFIGILVINLFSFSLFYLCFFYYLKSKV